MHKGYMDENLRQGLKAQAVAVKLLDIEGLQGHREWLVSWSKRFLSSVGLSILFPFCSFFFFFFLQTNRTLLGVIVDLI